MPTTPAAAPLDPVRLLPAVPVAPALDLLRFDLNETQLWFLGLRWSLGIDAFQRGEDRRDPGRRSRSCAPSCPALLLVGISGRGLALGPVFCGWLCPHFSLVETLNDLLHRACGKFSFWDLRHPAPAASQPGAGGPVLHFCRLRWLLGRSRC